MDFTGQTKAVQSVDIIPLVTGYLVEMPFREGAEVKEGDLLFVVDRRPYKAQLDQAQGQVNLYQAQLKLARTTLARDRAVNLLRPGSVSPQQIDQEQAWPTRPRPGLMPIEKSMEISGLNHEFTRVLSPIDGQISFYRKTLGNLVNQNQTRLTTVVSVDPMYVYFEMDEPTLLRHRRAVNEGKLQAAQRQYQDARLHGAARRGRASRTRGPSTSSTTRSIPRRAASWCEESSPTRCPRAATG